MVDWRDFSMKCVFSHVSVQIELYWDAIFRAIRSKSATIRPFRLFALHNFDCCARLLTLQVQLPAHLLTFDFPRAAAVYWQRGPNALLALDRLQRVAELQGVWSRQQFPLNQRLFAEIYGRQRHRSWNWTSLRTFFLRGYMRALEPILRFRVFQHNSTLATAGPELHGGLSVLVDSWDDDQNGSGGPQLSGQLAEVYRGAGLSGGQVLAFFQSRLQSLPRPNLFKANSQHRQRGAVPPFAPIPSLHLIPTTGYPASCAPEKDYALQCSHGCSSSY